jgi:hypothetical protein
MPNLETISEDPVTRFALVPLLLAGLLTALVLFVRAIADRFEDRNP